MSIFVTVFPFETGTLRLCQMRNFYEINPGKKLLKSWALCFTLYAQLVKHYFNAYKFIGLAPWMLKLNNIF